MTETTGTNTAQPSAAPQPDPQFKRSVYLAVFAGLRRGETPASAAKALMDKGLDQASASAVAQNVQNFVAAFAKAIKSSGSRNALIGGLFCVGGTVVTVVTYEAARGGGTYVVAWGAIVFGAIQMLRGLFMLGRKPKPEDLIRAFKL